MATGQGRRRPCPLLAVGMCRQRPVLCLSAVTSVIPAASGLSVRMLATLNAACHGRRDLIKHSSWALGTPAQGAHTNQSEERVLTRKQPPLQHPPPRGGAARGFGAASSLCMGVPRAHITDTHFLVRTKLTTNKYFYYRERRCTSLYNKEPHL